MTRRTRWEIFGAILNEANNISKTRLFHKVASLPYPMFQKYLLSLEEKGMIHIAKKEVPVKSSYHRSHGSPRLLSNNPKTRIECEINITPKGKEFLRRINDMITFWNDIPFNYT